MLFDGPTDGPIDGPINGSLGPPIGGPIMSDVKWLTYAELAGALGIGGDSARNLVRRKRWQRKPGNDGLARIGVPVEHLDEHAKPDGPIDPPVIPSIEPPTDARIEAIDGGIIEVLNRHIERLEREVESVKQERDAERVRAAQVDILNAVLEVERRQAGELRAERDQAVERLNLNINRLDRVQAEHHAELMAVREQMTRTEHDRDRAAADLAALLALPWWRRLFA